MKKIYFTVTNDLTYDQRMHRICTSLAANRYEVTLVGRKLPSSPPLKDNSGGTINFKQKRIRCWFNKGKLFYFEYNLRLGFYLLWRRMDAICAIDLDTIVPCYAIAVLKRVPRIYDAHELFTELKEVVTRPRIQKIWKEVEKKLVPKFRWGYTVSAGIAEEFYRRYHVSYAVIRNIPLLRNDGLNNPGEPHEKFILYQGAVNEGRGFEQLIPAMQSVRGRLVICGDGNFMPQLKKLINAHKLEEKIELKGMLLPDELREMSRNAYIGVALAENEGLNQYLALPNKFFDYMHATLPQVTMNYPEYCVINAQFEVAVLIADLAPETIAGALNNLLENDVMYKRLKENCFVARQALNWQQEEKNLLAFYQSVFSR